MTKAFILISLAFTILERLIPWRKEQPMLRKGFLSDLIFIAFNGYLFSKLFYFSIAATVLVYFSHAMEALGVWHALNSAVMREQPVWAQFLVLFLIQDFLKWGVHNVLHRVPFLWEFHKVHHSVEIMDWMGNIRYHWMEVIVYNSLLFVPLSFLGFNPHLFFWTGIIEIIVGHCNHSNLNIDLKWLRFLINSPRFHIWHHAADDPQAVNKNFGIVLSLWDWIFNTAYMPTGRFPARLGFEGMQTYPSGFPNQYMFPLSLFWKNRKSLPPTVSAPFV